MPAASSPVAEPRALRSRPVCRLAAGPDERARHFAIRRAVFCAEQGMFGGADDRDARDDAADTLHAVGAEGAVVGGTVRLYPLAPDGLWQGDRLAVLSAYRAHGVGGPLVRYAVATAAVLGGRTMSAHIQPGNVTFFRRLGWTDEGEPEIYAGLPHQPMSIALPSYREGIATIRRLEGDLIGPGPSPG